MKNVLTAKDIFSKSNYLDRFKNTKNYIHEEFQDFGFRLAAKLEDMEHKALYINFAKNLPRSVLEQVMEFTLDYPLKNGKRAKVFMWKLNQLCKEKGIVLFHRSPKIVKEKPLKPQLGMFNGEDDPIKKKVIKKRVYKKSKLV